MNKLQKKGTMRRTGTLGVTIGTPNKTNVDFYDSNENTGSKGDYEDAQEI